MFRETAQQLLQLASANQVAFKGCVARVDAEQKAFMEGILREGGSVGTGGRVRRGEGRDGAGEPSIALKMSFGQG